VAGRRRLREEVEQRVRVPGPEGRVGGGNAGEIIREAHCDGGRAAGGGGAGGGGGAEASGGVVRCASRHSGHAPGWPLGASEKTVRFSRDMRTLSSDAR